MASASKTPNLNLPQWVGTEKPERTDFNAAFLALDAMVVESQNEPGSQWVKWSDGTLFQTKTYQLTWGSFVTLFSVGERNTTNLLWGDATYVIPKTGIAANLPVPFVGAYQVKISGGRNLSGTSWVFLTNMFADAYAIMKGTYNDGNSIQIEISGWGRWKA